jgi:hypothetical protein
MKDKGRKKNTIRGRDRESCCLQSIQTVLRR